MTTDNRKNPRMSLSGKILLGMGLGIPVGIFFGEEVAFLNFAGEAFVQLLQISILPFVLVSLIVGLGKLNYDQARDLAKKGGLLLGLLWLLGLAIVGVMPLSYPNWESASFFVPSLVEESQEVDFLQLYIPANPFFSLANAIVPAIVVFGLIMGIALIGVPGKQGLLDMLSVVLEVLTRVTEIVVRLAPYGVFAIAASAAGTMDLDELGRLRVFCFRVYCRFPRPDFLGAPISCDESDTPEILGSPPPSSGPASHRFCDGEPDDYSAPSDRAGEKNSQGCGTGP